MSTQLDLTYDPSYRYNASLDRVMQELRKLVDRSIPFKDIVCDTDTRPSTLSQAMRREGGHRPTVDVLVYCLINEPSTDLIRALAETRDLDVRPRELTADQKVASVQRWLNENPALRKTFEDATGVKL